jgi:hypothetical protein
VKLSPRIVAGSLLPVVSSPYDEWYLLHKLVNASGRIAEVWKNALRIASGMGFIDRRSKIMS